MNEQTACATISIVSIGLLLTIILVPMSFQYVDYDEVALMKSRTSGKINFDKVYEMGRYFTNPDNVMKKFPAAYTEVTVEDQEVASAEGTAFYINYHVLYKFSKDNLADVYETFADNYEQSFRTSFITAVKNTAPLFELDDFIFNREAVTYAMWKAINDDLEHMQIDPGFFNIFRIEFPESVQDILFETAIQTLENEIATLNQELIVIQKETENQVAEIEAEVAITEQTATETYDAILQNATNTVENLLSTVDGDGLSGLFDAVGVTDLDQQAEFRELFVILDGKSDNKILSGFKDTSTIVSV